MARAAGLNASCTALEHCAYCTSFGAGEEECADPPPHCGSWHFVTASTMMDPQGADDWINCTGRESAGEHCSFRFVLDPPRALVFTDPRSYRCTGDPKVVAGLVVGALLLMWLVLAMGLGLPRYLLGKVRGHSLEYSGSARGSTRGSTRSGTTRSGIRRNYSVRSN